MERPQAWWSQTPRLAEDPHTLPGRRMERSPRGRIDEQTLEIRAAEFTTCDVGPSHGLQANHCRATDAPTLPELLDQIPPNQEIASVTAPSHGLHANRCRATDGAFDARKCHDAIHCPAVHVYMHERGRTWGCGHHSAQQEREAMEARQSRRPRAERGPLRIKTLRPDDLATPLGSILWMRLKGNGWSVYHCRSHVETKMHCVKLPGQRRAARDFDRQVAEVQIRVAVLNGFTALGTPITEVVG
jgi:hypothetical protein